MLRKTQATNVTTNQSTAIHDTVWWMRVILGVEIHLTDALTHILHNHDNDPTYTGLTDNEVQLYNQMVTFKNTHKPKLRKVIHEDQWNILCPSSGRSDSSTWDITLLIVVIRYCTDLPSPLGGWEQKLPQKSDTSKAAFVLRSRKFRNDVKHGSIRDISTKAQFAIYWGNMETLLNGLKYTNMSFFYDLETATLKMYTKQVAKALEERIADIDDKNADTNDEIKTLKSQLSLLQTSQAKNDAFHKIFKSDLKRIETDVQALKLKEALPLTTGIYWNVYQNVQNYCDRKDAFTKIKKIFENPEGNYDHTTVVIHGLGGVGKTEAAANYAKYHKNSYNNIIWLDCENIQDSVKELFTCYCINNGQSSVTAYLNAIYTTLKDTKCLFILDNIEDYDAVDEFFKSVETFIHKPHFLITTQRFSWDHGKFHTLDLSVFSKEESISFIHEAFPAEEKESIMELVDVLECFPLALQQARSYIKKHEIAINSYIRCFKEHNAKILNINLKNFGSTNYKKTLLTVWELALERIRSNEISLAILGIMAYMDGKRINKNTFLYHELINEDEIKLNEVIDILTEYSLIQLQNTKEYKILIIHSLVQRILLGNPLRNVVDHYAETIILLDSIASSNKYDDSNNLWYVHAKFILMQINVIKDNDILQLSSPTIYQAVNRMDFNVCTHIINLVSNMPDLMKGNVDANQILIAISQVITSYVTSGVKMDICEKLLSDGVRVLRNYSILSNVKHIWHLSCLQYYLKVGDVKNIEQNYSMIKDISPFSTSCNEVSLHFYTQKLKVLSLDFKGGKCIIKNKKEWLHLINEPIEILEQFLDLYGSENNSLVDLYFRCVLWKIEMEITDGKIREDNILLVKEKMKLFPSLTSWFRFKVTNLRVLSFFLDKKYKESLDISYQLKNNLLKEYQSSSVFADHEYNLEILNIDYNISLLNLKLKLYKDAHLIILTNLYEHSSVNMDVMSRSYLLYAIAKIMCNEIESAKDKITQIPDYWLCQYEDFINLHNFLCCYIIKNQEFKTMNEHGDQRKVKLLLQKCIHLRQQISTLCSSIILSLSMIQLE